MLKILKVYRYRKSGKLIASGLGNGYVFALNSDFTFSTKEAYRVRWSTGVDETPYRIEVELGKQNQHDTYRIVRTWDENLLPPKSSDPNAPLEYRIDVSPSQELTSAETRHVRPPTNGSRVGMILIVASIFLIALVNLWGWGPPFLTFVTGVIVAIETAPTIDPTRMREVWEAKERLRHEAKRQLDSAMQDVRAWAALNGIEFEHAVARIYRDQGYKIEFTPRTNDHGVDLILQKDGLVSIVQCKAYRNNVGVSAVRELAGVRGAWPNAEEAILVTLFDFSSAAKTFAFDHNIKLFSVARDYLKTEYRPER